MRIDAHQHFWRYNPAEHAWMTDKMAVLQRDYLPADLKPLLENANFQACIVVQVRQNLEETRWLLELADQNSFVRGVVGWVDLRSDDLSQQLDQFARHPLLVGVRHIVQDEPDDEFMLRADFQRGIARLAEYNLAYDILVYPRQLPAAVRLVEKFSRQRFVLDHIAKPPIADGSMGSWEADIRALAAYPNVYCKLSGMCTEARWQQWQHAHFHPYLDIVFEAFGADRLMIGSDWPVCTLSADYPATLGIVMDYVRQHHAADQEKICGDNCASFYGVG